MKLLRAITRWVCPMCSEGGRAAGAGTAAGLLRLNARRTSPETPTACGARISAGRGVSLGGRDVPAVPQPGCNHMDRHASPQECCGVDAAQIVKPGSR